MVINVLQLLRTHTHKEKERERESKGNNKVAQVEITLGSGILIQALGLKLE